VRSALGAAAAAAVPMGFKGWRWLRAVGSDLEAPSAPRITACFDRPARARLMAVPDLLPLDAEAQTMARDAHPGDLLEKATRADFMGYLADDILVKVDRASMLASLEVRAPLLDPRMIEFAFGCVPSHLKATASKRKILLKRLAQRLLPPEFDQKRKQGFCIPLDTWLAAGPWRRFFEDVLLDAGRESPFDRRWVACCSMAGPRGCAMGAFSGSPCSSCGGASTGSRCDCALRAHLTLPRRGGLHARDAGERDRAVAAPRAVGHRRRRLDRRDPEHPRRVRRAS
jgi:hypothetical protein